MDNPPQRQRAMHVLAVLVVALGLAIGGGPAEAADAPATVPQAMAALQTALKERGYTIDRTDGVWTPMTKEAVELFQRDRGLPVSGYPDSMTFQALGIPFNPALRRGSASSGQRN